MRDEGVIYVAGHPLLNGRCTRLPGCIRLRNDLYCVEWGVKLYSLTLELIHPDPRSSRRLPPPAPIPCSPPPRHHFSDWLTSVPVLPDLRNNHCYTSFAHISRSSNKLLLSVLCMSAFSVSAPSVWNWQSFDCHSTQLACSFQRMLKIELFDITYIEHSD